MFKVGDTVIGTTGRIGTIKGYDSETGEYLVVVEGKTSWRILDPTKVKLHNHPLKEIQTGVCSHSFKSYIGFTQSFDYCIHCDQKRDLK